MKTNKQLDEKSEGRLLGGLYMRRLNKTQQTAVLTMFYHDSYHLSENPEVQHFWFSFLPQSKLLQQLQVEKFSPLSAGDKNQVLQY